jgi:surfeit locus 1 family protein
VKLLKLVSKTGKGQKTADCNSPGSQMRNRIVPTLAALGAFVALIALGVWQMERRAWKNDLIARLEAALSEPPATYNPAKPAGAEAHEFKLVRVRGEFLNTRTVKVLTPAPETARMRTQEGFGYLIYSPLKFSGGIVFVNRGFVPQSLGDSPVLFSQAEIEVTGIVRLPAPPGWLTPPPEPAKRLFFAADLPAMAAAAGLNNKETIVHEYIEATPVPGAAAWPLPRDPRVLLASIPNRHLEYALTWFALAAAFAGFFIIAIRRA